MRVLFVLPNQYLPEFRGGEETTVDTNCRLLLRRGVRCAVLCRLSDAGVVSSVHKLANCVHRRFRSMPDTVQGYPTYRAHDIGDILAQVLDQFAPSVIVFQKYLRPEWLDMASRRGIPGCFYFNDAGLKWTSVQPGDALTFIANSRFTAGLVEQYFGRPAEVVYPIVQRERYETTADGRRVLFVNPIEQKGLAVAMHLARARGDVGFTFLEAWKLPAADRRGLEHAIAALPNVKLAPPVRDVKTFYRQTRLVLMPSKGQETWGRVATEAQFSGIPALASAIGGLPESVGPAGMLVPADAPMSEWLDAFNTMWDDPGRLAALADAARDHARRPEIDPDRLLDRLVQILQGA